MTPTQRHYDSAKLMIRRTDLQGKATCNSGRMPLAVKQEVLNTRVYIRESRSPDFLTGWIR